MSAPEKSSGKAGLSTLSQATRSINWLKLTKGLQNNVKALPMDLSAGRESGEKWDLPVNHSGEAAV